MAASAQAPKTMGELINDFFRIHYSKKVLIKRNYDNWFFKQLWDDKKRSLLIKAQKLDLDAHQKYGSDIAVAKFVVGYCLGRVRNEHGKWLSKKKELPPDYSRAFKITGIEVNKTKLMTEGIDNFVGLDALEMLNLSSNSRLDDFACDQLARQFRHSKTLHEINLSNNPLISIYGLEALFRIPTVKKIVATGTRASKHPEIDLFTLAAQDERQCEILVHSDGRQFLLPELEDLRTDIKRITAS